MTSEILVVPAFGQGHLFPCVELCKHLTTRGFKATLVVAYTRSSSIPASLRQHPLVEIAVMGSPPPSPESEPAQLHQHFHQQMLQGLDDLLAARFEGPNPDRLVYAVLDDKMYWTKEIFMKFGVPIVCFFTSGACSAALDYAAWKANVQNLKPGEVRLLPGLPEYMGLTYLDLKRRPHGPPPHLRRNGPSGQPGFGIGGPPGPGGGFKWVAAVESSIALMINTCDDMERPFLDYIANQIEKPVWGVGPLLPKQYWKSIVSIAQDREIRPNYQSNFTEEEVIEWLDSKPRGSVLYVAFGSEVGPSLEEYPRLADALEESNRPFIWAIQPGSGKSNPVRAFFGLQPSPSDVEEGYYPRGLESRVGRRGLIICGWAPQLVILSHPSTGGFLSHCGWNSTVEAMGRGVPLLAWPIRGDQYYNAKLVVCHLKMGYVVSNGDLSEMVKKADIVQGIERLMADDGMKKRAAELRAKFEHGFPASSVAALDAFRDFINQTQLTHQ